MTGSFLHTLYAETNADLAEKFGVDDRAELQRHFFRYGQGELRGASLTDHMNLEGIRCSESGHVFLSGWFDRRVVPDPKISIEFGYMKYDIGNANIVWYDRGDVADVIGDTENPSGFMAIFKVPGAVMHPRVCVRVNGQNVFEDDVVRFLSLKKFMNEALSACAVLADLPIGNSIESGSVLYPVFADIWLELLDGMNFAEVFSNRVAETVSKSIIITLFRKADMLFPQLEELAKHLKGSDTEVILVGNELTDTVWIANALAAFCQIYPIDISFHLCTGNSGFSMGNNYGAEQARGDILIFMNPDIFPPEGAFDKAIAFFDGDPGIALHGAALYYGDGMLMHSGMYVAYDPAVNQRTGEVGKILRVEHFGKGLSHRVDEEDQSAAFRMVEGRSILVSAALWKIRKSVFDAAGGLPADYIIAYYEDADFCLQFLENGGEIILDRSARWLHMEGVGKPKPPAVRTFMWLNRIHFSERFGQSDFVVGPEVDRELL